MLLCGPLISQTTRLYMIYMYNGWPKSGTVLVFELIEKLSLGTWSSLICETHPSYHKTAL